MSGVGGRICGRDGRMLVDNYSLQDGDASLWSLAPDRHFVGDGFAIW